WILRALSVTAGLSGRLDEAEELSRQAMGMFVELGDPLGLLIVSYDQAMAALLRGDYARARALFDEPVARARQVGGLMFVSVVVGLGILELRERRYAEAEAVFVEMLECSVDRGLIMFLALSLRGLAATAMAGGRIGSASRMLGAADRID